MNPQLSIPQAELQAFCRAHAVRELSVFGSAVRGDFGTDSDVDLIVVWKDENPPPKRAAAVRRALGHVGFPLDLAVVTPTEFARLKEWQGGVFHAAAREGVVLHAA